MFALVCGHSSAPLTRRVKTRLETVGVVGLMRFAPPRRAAVDHFGTRHLSIEGADALGGQAFAPREVALAEVPPDLSHK